MRSTTALRDMLRQERLLIAPGAFDALSASLIEGAGFEVVYMSGGGAACSLIGQPDLGLLGLGEMCNQAARVSGAVSVPVVADCDTGFGNAMNTIRAVEQYEQAGVAALHLEDQVFPKRCGHLPGKQVVPVEEHEAKIRAAVYARHDPDLVIIARTDTRSVHGIKDAVERARRYAEAGADMVFAEGLQSVDEVAAVAAAAGVPVLVNQVPGGQAPLLPHDELVEAGCRLVIYPSVALSSAVIAIETALAALVAGEPGDETALSPSEIFNRVGLARWHRRMERFATEQPSARSAVLEQPDN